MKILHFIDSLDYGGAEMLLMSYIPLLSDYEHIVVTLNGPHAFEKANYEYIQLNLSPTRNIFQAIKSLRQIIKEKQVDIVHSHSFWTNIISRSATPRSIKLINHYHFADYDTMKFKASVKRMILLDRLLSRKGLIRVAVSEYVANILRCTFKKATISVLPNFVNCNSSEKVFSTATKELKVVAIGNCSFEKNYEFVIQAFEKLKDEPISVDIIGGGARLDFYREEVKRLALKNVRFCGSIPNARNILGNYDLFLSASKSETFGIAVLEGVCAQLPLLLSDIPAFKEIAPKNTRFFKPYDKEDLVNNLKYYLHKRQSVDYADYKEILQRYSAQTYLSSLENLYNS